MQNKYDITVVLNAHSEGWLLAPSIESIRAAKRHAAMNHVTVEVIAVLDRPDPQTVELIEAQFQGPDFSTVTVDVGDPGLARNKGVELAQGTFIAFLDGDDLYSENWLTECFKVGSADARKIIWHPESNIYFPNSTRLFRHVDMEDKEFDLLALAMSNYWTSLSFAARTTYLDVPFRATELKSQIGHEDWAWNCETISRGYIHKIVPLTCHAIRTKAQSQLTRANSMRVMTHPTPLFFDLLDKQRDAN